MSFSGSIRVEFKSQNSNRPESDRVQKKKEPTRFESISKVELESSSRI